MPTDWQPFEDELIAFLDQQLKPTHDDKALPLHEEAVVIDFEKGDFGRVPTGVSTGLTGGGRSVRWETRESDGAPSGGIVFRYADEDNYYVVRANSLENNVVAYKTAKGKRSSIGVRGKGDAYGMDADVPFKQWNTLRVIARGKVFEVFLNGRKLFEVEDDTFTGSGKVGLWTKADAVTEFDDLTTVSLD